MARDPVCGMNVKEDKGQSIRSEFKGQNYYFCSDKCQKEFDRNPASFTKDKDNQGPKDKDNPRPKDDRKPR